MMCDDDIWDLVGLSKLRCLLWKHKNRPIYITALFIHCCLGSLLSPTQFSDSLRTAVMPCHHFFFECMQKKVYIKLAA